MTIGDRIRDLRLEHGFTQKDLADRCGYTSLTSINKIEMGINSVPISVVERIAKIFQVTPSYLIGWTDDKTPQPKAVSGITSNRPLSTRRVPMLGEIACGEPILRVEDYENYIEVDSSFKADYCLMCKGDSMVGARINDGDIVFIRKQEMVEHGEIAAVAIDDNATLKRVFYYPEKSKVVLQAENSNYEPLVYIGEEINDITILGKAVFFQSTVK